MRNETLQSECWSDSPQNLSANGCLLGKCQGSESIFELIVQSQIESLGSNIQVEVLEWDIWFLGWGLAEWGGLLARRRCCCLPADADAAVGAGARGLGADLDDWRLDDWKWIRRRLQLS